MLSGPFLVKKQRLPSVHALSGILTPCEFDLLIDYHAVLPSPVLPIALKFGRYLGTAAAEVPVKFQSDTTIATSNLAASRLHEIWR